MLRFFLIPFINVLGKHIVSYPTPLILSYWWNFGSLAGVALVVQILTGVFLAMHYAPHIDCAFSSIEHIMRDVNFGWLLRYIHANGASLFFVVVYIHIFRGLFFGSYKAPKELTWFFGIIILFLMMATAFLGYVLPWGQMSFWGATVITNLFSAIPLVGGSIVEWLWGGFSVDNATLNRFFSFHYLLPFMLVAFVCLHIIALHECGSGNALGFFVNVDKITFYPYFYIKDLLGFFFFLVIFGYLVCFIPNTLGHPDNYIPANPMVTPAHIVPEWYFLPFYAILRSIPDKLGGVILMFFSIVILLFLPYLNSSMVRSSFFRPLLYFFMFWFLVIALGLGWIGGNPVEAPYQLIGQILSFLYFAFFLLVFSGISLYERSVLFVFRSSLFFILLHDGGTLQGYYYPYYTWEEICKNVNIEEDALPPWLWDVWDVCLDHVYHISLDEKYLGMVWYHGLLSRWVGLWVILVFLYYLGFPFRFLGCATTVVIVRLFPLFKKEILRFRFVIFIISYFQKIVGFIKSIKNFINKYFLKPLSRCVYNVIQSIKNFFIARFKVILGFLWFLISSFYFRFKNVNVFQFFFFLMEVLVLNLFSSRAFGGHTPNQWGIIYPFAHVFVFSGQQQPLFYFNAWFRFFVLRFSGFFTWFKVLFKFTPGFGRYVQAQVNALGGRAISRSLQYEKSNFAAFFTELLQFPEHFSFLMSLQLGHQKRVMQVKLAVKSNKASPIFGSIVWKVNSGPELDINSMDFIDGVTPFKPQSTWEYLIELSNWFFPDGEQGSEKEPQFLSDLFNIDGFIPRKDVPEGVYRSLTEYPVDFIPSFFFIKDLGYSSTYLTSIVAHPELSNVTFDINKYIIDPSKSVLLETYYPISKQDFQFVELYQSVFRDYKTLDKVEVFEAMASNYLHNSSELNYTGFYKNLFSVLNYWTYSSSVRRPVGCNPGFELFLKMQSIGFTEPFYEEASSVGRSSAETFNLIREIEREYVRFKKDFIDSGFDEEFAFFGLRRSEENANKWIFSYLNGQLDFVGRMPYAKTPVVLLQSLYGFVDPLALLKPFTSKPVRFKRAHGLVAGLFQKAADLHGGSKVYYVPDYDDVRGSYSNLRGFLLDVPSGSFYFMPGVFGPKVSSEPYSLLSINSYDVDSDLDFNLFDDLFSDFFVPFVDGMINCIHNFWVLLYSFLPKKGGRFGILRFKFIKMMRKFVPTKRASSFLVYAYSTLEFYLLNFVNILKCNILFIVFGFIFYVCIHLSFFVSGYLQSIPAFLDPFCEDFTAHEIVRSKFDLMYRGCTFPEHWEYQTRWEPYFWVMEQDVDYWGTEDYCSYWFETEIHRLLMNDEEQEDLWDQLEIAIYPDRRFHERGFTEWQLMGGLVGDEKDFWFDRFVDTFPRTRKFAFKTGMQYAHFFLDDRLVKVNELVSYNYDNYRCYPLTEGTLGEALYLVLDQFSFITDLVCNFWDILFILFFCYIFWIYSSVFVVKAPVLHYGTFLFYTTICLIVGHSMWLGIFTSWFFPAILPYDFYFAGNLLADKLVKVELPFYMCNYALPMNLQPDNTDFLLQRRILSFSYEYSEIPITLRFTYIYVFFKVCHAALYYSDSLAVCIMCFFFFFIFYLIFWFYPRFCAYKVYAYDLEHELVGRFLLIRLYHLFVMLLFLLCVNLYFIDFLQDYAFMPDKLDKSVGLEFYFQSDWFDPDQLDSEKFKKTLDFLQTNPFLFVVPFKAFNTFLVLPDGLSFTVFYYYERLSCYFLTSLLHETGSSFFLSHGLVHNLFYIKAVYRLSAVVFICIFEVLFLIFLYTFNYYLKRIGGFIGLINFPTFFFNYGFILRFKRFMTNCFYYRPGNRHQLDFVLRNYRLENEETHYIVSQFVASRIRGFSGFLGFFVFWFAVLILVHGSTLLLFVLGWETDGVGSEFERIVPIVWFWCIPIICFAILVYIFNFLDAEHDDDLGPDTGLSESIDVQFAETVKLRSFVKQLNRLRTWPIFERFYLETYPTLSRSRKFWRVFADSGFGGVYLRYRVYRLLKRVLFYFISALFFLGLFMVFLNFFDFFFFVFIVAPVHYFNVNLMMHVEELYKLFEGLEPVDNALFLLGYDSVWNQGLNLLLYTQQVESFLTGPISADTPKIIKVVRFLVDTPARNRVQAVDYLICRQDIASMYAVEADLKNYYTQFPLAEDMCLVCKDMAYERGYRSLYPDPYLSNTGNALEALRPWRRHSWLGQNMWEGGPKKELGWGPSVYRNKPLTGLPYTGGYFWR